MEPRNRLRFLVWPVLVAFCIAFTWFVGRDLLATYLIRKASSSKSSEAIELLKAAQHLSLHPDKIRLPLLAAYNGHAVSLDQDGHTDLAIEYFERALELDPLHPTVIHNLIVSLNNRAVSFSTTQEFDQGKSYYRRALDLLQRQPSPELLEQIHTNYSNLLTMWGQQMRRNLEDTQAEILLYEALRLSPSNAVAHSVLGDIAYDRNDFSTALQAYRRSLEAYAGSSDYLAVRIRMIEAEIAVEARLIPVRDPGGEFRLEVPWGTTKQLADQILNDLRLAGQIVRDKLGFTAQRPVNVRVFLQEDFIRVSRMPEWTSGLYDGKIRLRKDEIEKGRTNFLNLVVHELVHAALGCQAPERIPSWFHEGLAQWAEPYRELSDFQFDTRIDLLRQKFQRDFDLLEFDESIREESSGSHVKQLYLVSLGFVSWLIETKGKDALSTVLSELRAGEPFERAFEAGFGDHPRELKAQWDESMKREIETRPRPRIQQLR
jgi:tetratricopeptide (TPR) repeat protein